MINRLLVVVVALFLPWMIGGCESMGSAPSATVVGAKLGGLSLDGVRIDFDVKVRNPTAEPLALEKMQYALTNRKAGGDTFNEPFIEGDVATGVSDETVPARSSREIRVPAVLSFPQVLEAMDQGKPGSVVSYSAALAMVTRRMVPAAGAGKANAAKVAAKSGGARGATGAGGEVPLALPMKWDGEFPIPNMPIVEVTDIAWDDSGLLGANGHITMRVTNTNEFRVDLKRMSYKVQLQGATLSSGGLNRTRRLAPGEMQEITIPVRLSALKLGAAVLDAGRKNQAAYRMKADFDIGTPFGDLSYPFERTSP